MRPFDRGSLAKTLARWDQSFPLREAALAVGACVVIAAVILCALAALQPSRAKARAVNEAMFLQAAMAQLRAALPSGNVKGADRVWALAQSQGQPWARSPNGWTWQLLPATLQGDFPKACSEEGEYCTHFWLRYDYRDSQGMNAMECSELLRLLNADFDVQSIRRGAMTTALADNTCDRERPAAQPFLYLIAQ